MLLIGKFNVISMSLLRLILFVRCVLNSYLNRIFFMVLDKVVCNSLGRAKGKEESRHS